jgi:hypothetical protein
MKIKKKLCISFVCIIIFLAGVFFQRFLMRFPNKTCDNCIQTLLEDENSGLYFEAMHSLEIAKDGGLDTASSEFKKYTYAFLQQTDSIANYFNNILSSDEKLETFSFDKIRSILGDETYYRLFREFYSMEDCINFKTQTTNENRKYVNFYYNRVLRQLLEVYKTNALIPGWIECIFYPETDTVKIGEIYRTQICLKVEDIQNTYKLEFENGDVSFGDIYIEKATKRGINKRKGELIYLNGDHKMRFPFEFSFYVK